MIIVAKIWGTNKRIAFESEEIESFQETMNQPESVNIQMRSGDTLSNIEIKFNELVSKAKIKRD